MVVGFRTERVQLMSQHAGSFNLKFGLNAFSCLLLIFMSTICWATGSSLSDFDNAYRLTQSGAYSQALGIYDNIIRYAVHPHEQARALFLSGVIHHLYGHRPDQALSFFNKVLDDYPESPSAEDALFHSGIIYKEQEKNEAARKSFLSYLKKYPQGIRRPSAKLWYDSILRQINEPIRFNAHRRADDNLIRVLMATGEQKLTFHSKKSIFVYDRAKHRIYQGEGSVTFSRRQGRFLLNSQILNGDCFRISSDTGTIAFKTYECRGTFLVSTDNVGLQAVNYVSLKHYLYGILPKEMPYTWDSEALMAQAVASRTYALYLKSLNKMRSFDVVATMACQVYGGVGVERPSTNQAVDATKGRVVTYHNRLIAAYFHANSAGHTEDAERVWDVDLPYLKGVPDRFSENLPFENWNCYLSYENIAECLSNAGYVLGRVSAVTAVSVSTNGRILDIQVMTDDGPIDMRGGRFRHCLNPMRIKSTKFQIVNKDNGVFLRGKGSGHGVGMSQWGANQMAKEGFHYTTILSHYYPGAVVTKVDI